MPGGRRAGLPDKQPQAPAPGKAGPLPQGWQAPHPAPGAGLLAGRAPTHLTSPADEKQERATRNDCEEVSRRKWMS